jgi:hypothetical protein
MTSYIPSGKISWTHFPPLAAAGLVLSFCMAYALYQCEARFYYWLLTPVVLSLPLMGTLLLAIYFGRCRSPLVAGSVGVLFMTCYYAGYWLFSYHFNIVAMGRFGQNLLMQVTGQSGPIGYFILRCKMTGNGMLVEAVPLIVLNAAMRGLEFGVLLAMGLYGGRRFARRAYFEDHGRWASSMAFLFQPHELPLVLAAVERQEWPLLNAITKQTVTAEQRRGGGMLFRVEYLPRSSDQPAYVTVEGPVLRHARPLLSVLPVLGRWVTRFVSQRFIDANSLRELSQYVGGFDLPMAAGAAEVPSTSAGDAPAAPAELRYWSPDQRVEQVSATRGLTSILGEAGLIGAMPDRHGGDFRDRASAASAFMIGRWPDSGLDGIEGVDASLCYPAEANARVPLKRLSRLEAILAYVMVGCWLSASASRFIGGGYRQSGDVASADLAHFVGVSLFILGSADLLFLCIGYRWFQRLRLLRHFARRAGSLLLRDQPGTSRDVVRLEDAMTFHVSKITPEDWGICLFDKPRRRLLIEGVSHRYVIRGQDVTELRPAHAGASTSAYVRWRVGAEELSIVLNRPNMGHVLFYTISRVPLIGFPLRPFTGNGSVKLANRFAAALGFIP